MEELRSGDMEKETEKPSRCIPWAHYGGHVRVIAAILREEDVEEILRHLNLPTGPPKGVELSGTEYVEESFALLDGVFAAKIQ